MSRGVAGRPNRNSHAASDRATAPQGVAAPKSNLGTVENPMYCDEPGYFTGPLSAAPILDSCCGAPYGDRLHGAGAGTSGDWRSRRASQEGREPKANLPFLVTTVRIASRRLYERIDCQRKDVETRIQELEAGVEMDRTSCTSLYANQFRVLLAEAWYALPQELR